MKKYKTQVKPGDSIHIYHMFGYPEYKDCEGNVKYIDGNQIYGTWGPDPLIFADDWEIIEDD